MKEPVLALHLGLWHRGVAVLKKGQEFALFLVDIGQTVTVKLENIRPLLAEFQQIPPPLRLPGTLRLKSLLLRELSYRQL